MHELAKPARTRHSRPIPPLKAGFHFGEFGRATKRWAIRACFEIQAERERVLANAQLVLEVESSSTFSRPE